MIGVCQNKGFVSHRLGYLFSWDLNVKNVLAPKRIQTQA